MPTSPKDMMDAIERDLPARTGKTLAQWVALVKRGGPRDRRERVAWLRKEHGLVSLVRKRQFGAIQPSATDRVDLGLVLPGVEAKGRLEATTTVGGGRVTHRIPLRSPRDVDAEVRRWLKAAYDHDA